MRIVFMGTPDFAVPCLEALIGAGHEIVGVFTQPDKPVGRKQILTPPDVKVCAEKANPGEAVLLSPACASWGMFDNYEQRGRIFKELVRKL